MSKEECVKCGGIFAHNEKVIVVNDIKYCETCYIESEGARFVNTDLIRKIESKEVKSEAEWDLLSYHKMLAIVSYILVSESKLDISSEEAISKIRKCMSDNF